MRTFGIEIEFISQNNAAQIAAALTEAGVEARSEFYNHTTRRHWKLVTDASLSSYGKELVSPPLPFNEQSFEIVRKVCRVLDTMGARVDRSCGLHVHHDASDLSVDDWKRLLKNYNKHRALIDQVMPQSRRTGNAQWCRDVSDYALRRVSAAHTVRAIYSALATRYVAVNVGSYFTHGTVEFRQHGGTTDAAKMVSWIKLTNAIVEKARVEDVAADSLEDFLMAHRSVSGRAHRTVRLSTTGIGGMAYSLIEQGYDNRSILRLIQEANPEADTSIKCIYYYRSQYRKAQRAAGTTDAETTSRELIDIDVVHFFMDRANQFARRAAA